MDVKKFYPSINNAILKNKIRNIVKCKLTLGIIDNIIDSCKGLPIGNYTSQVLGNYYLSELDWYIKQDLGIKGYFRYCDDLVIFRNTAKELHRIKKRITRRLRREKLTIKDDWKVAKLNTGCDFVGYQFYESGYKLRDSIYKSAKAALKSGNDKSIPAYFGWVKVLGYSQIKRKYYNAVKCKSK